MCVCNFEMCVCNFEKREMKYELHFQFWIMFLTLCSVIDFVCVVTPVGHRTQGIRITCEFSGQPQEWFLKIIVTLWTDIIVPKVLFSVESDSFSLIQDQQKKYKTFS